jgi:hypothetical protein
MDIIRRGGGVLFNIPDSDGSNQLVEERREDPRTAGPNRVAQSDRPAVHVNLAPVEAPRSMRRSQPRRSPSVATGIRPGDTLAGRRRLGRDGLRADRSWARPVHIRCCIP